jgi:hypothetical protein
MSHRKILSGLVIGALAVAAAGAPAAMAIPADLPSGAAAKAQAPVFPQTANQHPAIRDARSPDAANPPHAAKSAPLPGPPTWPVNPKPIGHASQPAFDSGGGDDDGTDWLVPGLGLLAGSLILAGGLLATVKVRTARTHATH